MKKVQTKNKMKGVFGFLATLALAVGVGVSLAPRDIVKTSADTKKYEKVTSADELIVGANYFIAGVDEDTEATYVVSTTQGNNNRPAVAATMDGEFIVETETAQQFQLFEGTKANSYGFKAINGSNKGFLYAASSGSNYLRTEAEITDNSSWTISFSSEGATVVAQGANTRNHLRFNMNLANGDPLFSAYASTSSVKTLVEFYYDPASASGDPSVSINASSPSVFVGETLQLSSNVLNSGGASVSWSVNDSTIAIINSSTGLLTPVKTGNVIVTATLVVGGIDYEDTLLITVLPDAYVHAGTSVDPFTVGEALLKAKQTGTTETSQQYYVKGIVSEVNDIDTGSFGNATFKVKDRLVDSVSFGAYRVFWGESGVKFTTETAQNIVVGKEVILVGKIVNYMNNTPQVIQNSKVLLVEEGDPVYDEAKDFADWLLAVPESDPCADKFNAAKDKWEELSAEAKALFKADAEFQPAEDRLLQWALANHLSSLDDLDSNGVEVGKPNVKNDNTMLFTITILIGVIALTTLTGIYFIKKRQTRR